jgi:hypothetical protein
MRVTVSELASNLGVDYAVASALVKVALQQGTAKVDGVVKTTSGKGKPSVVYELPERLEVNLLTPLTLVLRSDNDAA